MRYTNVIENGSSCWAAKASIFCSTLPHFLPKIYHCGRGAYGSGNYHCRFSQLGISYKIGTSDSLLVMIFQEVEHMMLYIGHSFLHYRNVVRPPIPLHNVFDAVIELNFIIQVIHFTLMYVCSVQTWVIYFRQ